MVDSGTDLWYNHFINKGMNDMTNSIADTDICEFDFALELDDILDSFKMEGLMTREDMKNIFAEIVAEAFDIED